jgi:hypothetical protein
MWTVDGEDFDYRVKVTIDSANIDSTLSDFTVSIQISDLPQQFVDFLRSNGGDIRLTSSDGTTRLAIAVEEFNQGAYTGAIIGNVPTVASGSDTVLYVYGGNASATQPIASDTYGSENATNSNVTMRLPLDEDPSGVGEVMFDTTQYDNDGDPTNMESGDSVSSKINNGLIFDGSNEEVDVDDDPNIDPNYNVDFSIECAFNIIEGDQPDTTIVNNFIIHKWNSFATGYPYAIGFRNQTHTPAEEEGTIYFTRYDLTNAPIVFSANAGYNDGQWHHLTAWKDGGTLYLKIDGEAVQSTSDTTTTTTTNAAGLRIANSQIQGVYGSFTMDELLYHNVGVGEAHANARAVNTLTPTTFYSVAGVEGVWTPDVMIY